MRGCLMMSMVPGMLDGPGLCQPADGQDTEYQDNREDFQNAVAQWKTPQNFGANTNGKS